MGKDVTARKIIVVGIILLFAAFLASFSSSPQKTGFVVSDDNEITCPGFIGLCGDLGNSFGVGRGATRAEAEADALDRCEQMQQSKTSAFNECVTTMYSEAQACYQLTYNERRCLPFYEPDYNSANCHIPEGGCGIVSHFPDVWNCNAFGGHWQMIGKCEPDTYLIE